MHEVNKTRTGISVIANYTQPDVLQSDFKSQPVRYHFPYRALLVSEYNVFVSIYEEEFIFGYCVTN